MCPWWEERAGGQPVISNPVVLQMDRMSQGTGWKGCRRAQGNALGGLENTAMVSRPLGVTLVPFSPQQPPSQAL